LIKPRVLCTVVCNLLRASPAKLPIEDVFIGRLPTVLSKLSKEEISEVLIEYCDAKIPHRSFYETAASLNPVYPSYFDNERRGDLLSVFETIRVPAPSSLINAPPLLDEAGNALKVKYRKLY
jgi:hypothetical protein